MTHIILQSYVAQDLVWCTGHPWMVLCVRCGLAVPGDPDDPFFVRTGHDRCRLCAALDGLRQAVLQLERRTQLVGQIIFWLEQLVHCVILVNDYIVESAHARVARRLGPAEEDEGSDEDSDDLLRHAALP